MKQSNQSTKGLVDINNDPEEKIAKLELIGPLRAKKAIEIRNKENGFKSKEDFFEKMELKIHHITS